MTRIVLAPHPDCTSSPVVSMSAEVWRLEEGAVGIRFAVSGEIPRVRIPRPAAALRTDGLWRHTCFECFAKADAGTAYREFNFSPSGAWAAYAFSGYRTPAALPPGFDPRIRVATGASRLDLEAVIPACALPPRDAPGGMHRIALCAVVEDAYGRLTYWALRHAPGKADFHHPDAYALEI
jgi:hypothetical protein